MADCAKSQLLHLSRRDQRPEGENSSYSGAGPALWSMGSWPCTGWALHAPHLTATTLQGGPPGLPFPGTRALWEPGHPGHPGPRAAFPQCQALPLSAAQASPTQLFLKGPPAAIPPNYNLLHLHVVFHYNSSLHLSGWVARQPRADLLAHWRAGISWSHCSCAGGPLRAPPAMPCACCARYCTGSGRLGLPCAPDSLSVCWLTRGPSGTVNPVLGVPVPTPWGEPPQGRLWGSRDAC